MMNSPIAGLDRVSIAVENLEVARGSFETLGFQVSERGRHVGRGTGNYCLMLSGVDGHGAYIELVAQTDSHDADPLLSARIASKGEGLVSLGLRTQDAEAAAAAMELSEPFQSYRSVEQDGISKMASFNLLSLLEATQTRPAIGAVEHFSQDLIFQPSLQTHRNTAQAIREIHVRSDSVRDDVIASVPFCTPAQTDAQRRAVDGLMGGSRVARLTYLSDKAWGDLYGEDDTATAGLVIECENAITAKHGLEEAGFEPEFVNSKLNGYRIPVDKTHGVWFTFVAV